MPPLSAPSAEGSLVKLAGCTIPLLLLAAAGSARAADQFKFRIFENDVTKKVFLIGVFDVILSDQVFGASAVPLPAAISIESEGFGKGPVVLTPEQALLTPDSSPFAITWSGKANQLVPPGSGSGGSTGTPGTVGPQIGKFSIFSSEFLQAASNNTWESLAGKSFNLAFKPDQVPVSVQFGPLTLSKPGPVVFQFDPIPRPPSTVPPTGNGQPPGSTNDPPGSPDQPVGANGDPPSVPGPLPLLGVGAGLGFSRKLRQRLKATHPCA